MKVMSETQKGRQQIREAVHPAYVEEMRADLDGAVVLRRLWEPMAARLCGIQGGGGRV